MIFRQSNQTLFDRSEIVSIVQVQLFYRLLENYLTIYITIERIVVESGWRTLAKGMYVTGTCEVRTSAKSDAFALPRNTAR